MQSWQPAPVMEMTHLMQLRHIGVIIYPNKSAGLQNGGKSEECQGGMPVDYGNSRSNIVNRWSNASNLLLLSDLHGAAKNEIRKNIEYILNNKYRISNNNDYPRLWRIWFSWS